VFLSIDHFVITAFLLAQWRITVLLLSVAARRLSAHGLRAARYAIFAWDAVLLVGYLCTLSELVSALHFPARLAAVLGALSLLYCICAVAFVLMQMVLAFLLRRVPEETSPARRRLLSAAGNTVMAAPFAVLAYGGLVERLRFGVREVDVPIPGLPKDLEGIRIVQISDIHLSAFLSEDELARVVDAAVELRPHIAVVTGDLITAYGDPLDACIRQLSRLKADAGVFGCMGNHERYAKAEDYTARAAARSGIRFLRHQAQPLRFGNAVLNLAGVDYQSVAKKSLYLRGADRLLVPGATNILLSHNPDVFPVAARQGYNLLLAGHTHGGQVAVEILDQSLNPARFFTPYTYGLYQREGASAYVTRGIGTIGIPARVGAPPEISVLRLRKA
jgi:predicted MPP superfamily phosphohydrolase